MHLSTSSSNDRLPKGYNWIYLCMPFFLFIAILCFFELHLRSLGWQPSIVDSAKHWSLQRKKASVSGKNALILVGASRMQLGLDLNIAKEVTGLQPVQLAIDGSPFIPVLHDLAMDDSVTGTILIAVSGSINLGDGTDKATEWVQYYKNHKKIEPYKIINNFIKSFFDECLVTRLSGAKPATIVSSLAFKKKSNGNYLITNRDRSKEADYQKVLMPHFYFSRVERNFGSDLFKRTATYQEFLDTYKIAIQKIQAIDKQPFLLNLDVMLGYIQKIEKRGGKVILIRFPTDKLIWEMDKRRYPRNIFWDLIARKHKNTIHFKDYTKLSSYSLPDGSHLDYRDKKSFTSALMKIIAEE